MIQNYDPAAESESQAPHAGWARARAEQPVFYTPQHNLWWVTKYDDVTSVLRDPVTFSSKASLNTVGPPLEIADEFTLGLPWEHTLVVTDPPEHSRVRRLVQTAFTPKVVAELEPSIREIANTLIDKFIDRGEVDLVPVYSEPIPLIVVTRILGAPEADAPQLREWTNDFFRLVGSASTLHASEVLDRYSRIARFQRYCVDLIEDRRAAPKNDLVTALIQAETAEGDPQLTTIELISVIMSLFTAGNETSASLISETIYCLMKSPEQWAEVRADLSLVPAAVEETLRLLGPVKGIQRTATRETSIDGVAIPAGAQIYLLLGSANRDDGVWDRADTFDLHRPNVLKHVMFGQRTHFCVGAHLARLEGKVALECLAARMPKLEIAANQDIAFRPTVRVHSPSSLPVVW